MLVRVVVVIAWLVRCATSDTFQGSQTVFAPVKKDNDGLQKAAGITLSEGKCPVNDLVCEKDWIGYEAIAQLHARIDDDQNGGLDRLESDEFIREDLQYKDGKRGHANFHGSDDFITVQDLWHLWSTSKVYKWTVEDVIDWLSYHVELPQYADSFRVNAVNGHVLPRLASNTQAVANILGIKNNVHKQKLAIKAMDLVLFGPPKVHHSFIIDVIIVLSVSIAAIGCWFAYRERRSADTQMQKLMLDMAALQSAEDALVKLQQQVEVTVREQQQVISDRHDLEQRLLREIDSVKGETEILRQQHVTAEEQLSELRQTEEQLTHLRAALSEAERRLEESYLLPACLQPWLQVTYDIESRYFEAKRNSVQVQLKSAKDMCERLHSEKAQLFSALRMAHSSSLDDTDQTIYNVKCALEETKRALQERMHRWQQIENICGFTVTSNTSANSDSRSQLDLDARLNPALTGGNDVELADDEMPSLPMIAHAFNRTAIRSNKGDFTLNQLVALSQSSYGRPTRFDSKINKTGTTGVIFETGDDSSSVTLSALGGDDQPNSDSSTPSTETDSGSMIMFRSSTVPSSLSDSAISLSVGTTTAAVPSLPVKKKRSPLTDEVPTTQSVQQTLDCSPAASSSSSTTVETGSLIKDAKHRSSLAKFFGKASNKRKTS